MSYIQNSFSSNIPLKLIYKHNEDGNLELCMHVRIELIVNLINKSAGKKVEEVQSNGHLRDQSLRYNLQIWNSP